MKREKEKSSKKINKQEIPDRLKVLLGIFNEKNPDIKLIIKEIKKAEDNI